MTPMPVISINGHPTWAYLPKKKGTVIVFLHGGGSSSASMLRSIGPRLAKRFAIAAFDRRGHGRTGDTEAPFTYDDMASQTIAFLEVIGRRAHVVGHSDGAIVALLVAMRRPDLLDRVVAIGANYHRNGLMELTPSDTESAAFAAWAQRYADASPDGIEHARVVAHKTDVMYAGEPNLTIADLAIISVPLLVMAGDDDVATLAHTCSLYEAVPDAQLAIIPGTSHGLLKERTKESAQIISYFLRSDLPPVTETPIRRQMQEPSDRSVRRSSRHRK
jgi:pimeloyl-ACP methyl ester carboxylesterase